MIRRVIQIEEDKCNGCGACAKACHEGAIGMVNGKAKLLRDDYCDGLGDCLPTCPTEAISFVEREAAAYDEKAVLENRKNNSLNTQTGCPGSQAYRIEHLQNTISPICEEAVSQLGQWPCQINWYQLAPNYLMVQIYWLRQIAVHMHMQNAREIYARKYYNHWCPKLDNIDYSEKLTQIIQNNDIKKVTIVRMEVPCCGGLEMAVKKALQASGKFIPWQVVTISMDGRILE